MTDQFPEEAEGLHLLGHDRSAAWWGGGISVIDRTDLGNMSLVGHICGSPPFPGGNHTCWPIGDKRYLIATDEHGRIYLIDRGGAGMHILEYTG